MYFDPDNVRTKKLELYTLYQDLGCHFYLLRLRIKHLFRADMNAAASTSEQSDRYVDRGRVNFWVQHIARLLNKSMKKMSVDDVQHIKSASCRLLALIEQSDKASKDALLKQPLAIDTLITVLQVVSCEQTVGNIISIFIEIVGKVHPAKRASVLVSHGLTTVLFQIMKLAHTNDISLSDDVLMSIHVLLTRIGNKDCKFAVKARLHQSLMLTLDLVKTNFHNFRNLQTLLQVMKMYTNNSVNSSYLGKHNTVSVLLTVIDACGQRHTVDLRLALENLCNLTRSKSNSGRFVEVSGVPRLLGLHLDWQVLDTKHRHLAIRRCILNILKNVTDLKAGRASFIEADGIRILYEGALEASDSRDMESLILLASIILRKCCPRNKLPLDSMLSPVLYPLPPSATHTPECYFFFSLPDQLSPHQISHDSSCLDVAAADKFDKICGALRSFIFGVSSEDGQTSSTILGSERGSLDDNEEEVDSDDERLFQNPEEPDEDQQDSPEPAEARTLEDLHMYDEFFPELLELQFQPFSLGSLVATPLHRSLSVNLNARSSSRDNLNPPAMKSVASETTLKAFSQDLLGANTLARESSQNLRGHLIATETHHSRDKSVSAINLKTGSSVITLDIGPCWSVASSKGSRTVARCKRKKKASTKDRQGSQRASATCLDEPLSKSFSSLSFPYLDGEGKIEIKCLSAEELDYDLCCFSHDPSLYIQMASFTKSVYKFRKLAFPDMHGVKGPVSIIEPLSIRKLGVQRAKIFEDIERVIHPDSLIDQVVYDLDQLVQESSANAYMFDTFHLTNLDRFKVCPSGVDGSGLRFNAQFECGNLRKVIQVRQYEYDLILNPDINSNHHHQWFYFEVSNMEADQPYRFNIINCEKFNSQFNFGMQPLMMSVTEAVQGNPCWRRVGTDICYYKNYFMRNPSTTGGATGKTYFTATFTLTFHYSGDICYLSYHYPYSYTSLQTHLRQWEENYDSSMIFFRNQSLCTTLGGNSVPLLTITAQPQTVDRDGIEELRRRPYIFLTGRVHPGESNASWVMKGTIDFLMSKCVQAQQVRQKFIFKIVPMLNPDGVINGNHRSSLVGEDLNRRWGKPCHVLHPTIYHTKGLLQYLQAINQVPLVYCDYHGHSRRKNIFLYGCSPNQTWLNNDTQNPASSNSKTTDYSYKQLPHMLNANCPAFCLKNCSYVVEKGKENTARVVVWRHIGVVRSYTMESSYCGCDQGRYKDMQMNTTMLERMGSKFCETLIKLPVQRRDYEQPLPMNDLELLACSEAASEFFEEDLEERMGLSHKKCNNADSLPDDSDSYDEDEEVDEEEFDDDVQAI